MQPTLGEESRSNPDNCVHLLAWKFHTEIRPGAIKQIMNTDLFTETIIIR